MVAKQRQLTEKILFDYYMISSFRENEVHCPYPFYIDKEIFNNMVDSAIVLNRIVCRITEEFIKKTDQPLFAMGDFPLINEILSLGCPLPPFFWVRYDAFVREEGGIFFSEFNYDKPCSQREIAISDMMKPYNNPNLNFKTAFRDNFKRLFDKNKKPTVAILLSPIHDEEVHLAHYYMDLLKDLDCSFVIAGTDNIYVKDEFVYAFDQKIDIILRQFPTEFLYEIEDIEKILLLYENGKINILNDPRAIIGQTKSLFAYLWDMVKKDSPFLNEQEKQIIRSTIPFTYLFEEANISELILEREELVIKAVYGRYSEQVYIGCMHTENEWAEVIQEVIESQEPHIVQQFCKIKRDEVLRYNGEKFSHTEAYGNIGIYLSNNEFIGTCIRWSPDYLSSDDYVWVTPIGIKKRTIDFKNIIGGKYWSSINEKAAFLYGFTGGYTGIQQSFSLQSLILDKDSFDEIKNATQELTLIFNKTTEHVLKNVELLCPVLNISNSITNLLSKQQNRHIGFIGRFDWVFDSIGDLKLLEFNSETPAGLIESIALNSLILEEADQKLINPNMNMKEQIRQHFLDTIKEYEKECRIENIGIVSLAYPEDWYNTQLLYDIIKDCPYNFVVGEVSGLEKKDGKLYLYRNALDAIYRYYPLDWFDQDPYYSGIIEAFANGTHGINPPSTIISQSKAFFALVWELCKVGFYSEKEMQYIENYIPFTSLDSNDFTDGDYCSKPYFGREGEEISFSIMNEQDEQTNLVYQQRIEIQSVDLDMHTTLSDYKINTYPILGAFVIGDEFGGIYTRAGGIITDQWSVYIPTYYRNLEE